MLVLKENQKFGSTSYIYTPKLNEHQSAFLLLC